MEIACSRRTFTFRPGQRPLVMGILNVTPDSFFDGGRHDDPGAAIEQARRLAADGADLIDVGAESTRPGARPVDAGDELGRLLPVIRGIARLGFDLPISVDTAKPEVADAALAAGADMINDVSGADEPMLEVAARHGAPVIAMHMQGEPRTMQQNPAYDDVTAEVSAFLAGRIEAGRRLGVQVLVDPGIGFGKALAHNLDLIANLGTLRQLGAPVVLGVSRKSFLDRLLGNVPTEERLAGTLAVDAWAAAFGFADIVRVHDVREHRHALKCVDALNRRRRPNTSGPRVLARGIACDCRIGVTTEERSATQQVLVDIEVTLGPAEFHTTNQRDDPGETLDYAELAAAARRVAAGGAYRLVETLAEDIAAVVASDAGANGAPGRRRFIQAARVRVTKPAAARALGAAAVGAEIDWQR